MKLMDQQASAGELFGRIDSISERKHIWRVRCRVWDEISKPVGSLIGNNAVISMSTEGARRLIHGAIHKKL